MIARLDKRHVNAVVGVHLAGFQGFFLSFLGKPFLRLFYTAGVEYTDAVGYVYLEGERVVGFVFGVTGPSRFYRFLLKTRWLQFALAALGAALQRPSIIPRLFRAWLYPSQTPKQAETATLMSIAVDPLAQGKGIGTQLAQTFLKAMHDRGARRVELTTDRYGNDTTNAFYQKLGFHCERPFVTAEGREMNEYVFCLRDNI